MQYCHYWQGKLADNKEIEFPDKICDAIAKITDDFSFAYIQEAFIAALLAIATSRRDPQTHEASDGDGELEKYVLWREIKKQVKILREEMDSKVVAGLTEMSIEL